MRSYELLTTLVEDQSISLINIVAVPRSVSTALGRSLNESDTDSIFVNEPFNRHNRSLEIASKHILDTVLPLLEKEGDALTVITKNMAAYLGGDEYRGFEYVSRGNVWSVRNPLLQIGSLVTRMANDLAIENGADEINQSTVGPYLEDVTRLLIKSDTSVNFSRTGWTSIGTLFRDRDNTVNSIVVDGLDLTLNPETVLEGASNVIGLEYSERMIQGWEAGYTNINTGTSRFSTECNAWTNRAATSRGLESLSRESIDIDILPPALKEYVLEIAIPTYDLMVGSS